ncbi:MAG: hypothetical protein EXQ52_08635 [Bryobacterales bacterium]|nr:hypothetical protein [Bryobacterales bacterium]
MTRACNILSQFLPVTSLLLMPLSMAIHAQDKLPYSTYSSFSEVLKGSGARYLTVTRVSDPGTSRDPVYTGFFFYQCLQFDVTGRFVLGMRVYFQNRPVQPTDRGDVGFIDLKDRYKWTKIGETTAWNWQQGSRLQWRPASDEVVWNDRSDDGKSFVCRVYNFRTGKRRTLPRPIYDLSPDGATALTHDFERMKHAGTDYAGIEDKYKSQHAPSQTGIWKMDMDSAKSDLVMPLDKMAAIAYPKGIPSAGSFYVFREGWNPSGTRFIAFVKDPANGFFEGFSMSASGTEVRYLYHHPSHHSWRDDNHMLDFGEHAPPGSGSPVKGYFLFKDDGTGKAEELLWRTDHDGHNSYVPGPGGDWIISDTYGVEGFQYLFMYHIPTKVFVPLAKLRTTAGGGVNRVDLHPRYNRDGRTVSIDSTHEGLGRQMYVIDISHILQNPPGGRVPAR